MNHRGFFICNSTRSKAADDLPKLVQFFNRAAGKKYAGALGQARLVPYNHVGREEDGMGRGELAPGDANTACIGCVLR